MSGLEAQLGPASPSAQAPAPQNPVTITLTLADAIERAKSNAPQFQAALTGYGLARQDRVQARAALLHSVIYNSSFVYTEHNGSASGVFIANNGTHEYISQGIAHEALGFGSLPDYQRAKAAQALAKQKPTLPPAAS